LWNGDVVLCCYDYDGFNVVGNVNGHSMVDIWNGKRVEQLRELFIERATRGLKLCSTCYLAPHNFSTGVSLSEKNWKEESVLLELIGSVHQKKVKNANDK